MIDAGDIHFADLNEEIRRRVLVVSNARFNSLSGRAMVAPEIFESADAVAFPWRVEIDGAVFAVDLLRSLPTGRLLDRVDRAPAAAMAAVRRAVIHVT
jgi:mRNA-degrading endonuclease toxin of MazEF toxin-antitoxin module